MPDKLNVLILATLRIPRCCCGCSKTSRPRALRRPKGRSTPGGAREINRTVHDNLEESKSVYDFVVALCISLGAAPSDMVPFEKYAAAAQGLSRPSSAARALFAGAQYIERADMLVQPIARQKGRSHPVIDSTVAVVDALLERNRTRSIPVQ